MKQASTGQNISHSLYTAYLLFYKAGEDKPICKFCRKFIWGHDTKKAKYGRPIHPIAIDWYEKNDSDRRKVYPSLHDR